MPLLTPQCRHPGCDAPRTRHSVFCDAHHEQQIFPRGRPSLESGFRHRIAALLDHFHRGTFTEADFLLNLYVPLLSVIRKGQADLCAIAFGLLTRDELAKLMAEVQAGELPWGFFCANFNDIPHRDRVQVEIAQAREELLRRLIAHTASFSEDAPD